MARIIYELIGDTEWHGPYPNKAGEFCGNVLREALFFEADGETVREHKWSFSYLMLDDKNVKFRIRDPVDCQAGSSAEMKSQGYVGLYLAEDQPQIAAEQDVDTDMFLEEVVSGERPPQKPFCLHRDQGL